MDRQDRRAHSRQSKAGTLAAEAGALDRHWRGAQNVVRPGRLAGPEGGVVCLEWR
jgi:hypothetical protein